VDAFNKRLDIVKYSRMVSVEEIEKNDFNLNLPRYIDSQEPEDLQDIEGHLKGGIPLADIDALQRYWDICPKLRATLFKPNRKGYVDLAVDNSAIKTNIYTHPEFVAFTTSMNAHFAVWRDHHAQTLRSLKPGFNAKEVIHILSEDLLGHYAGKPLMDAYAVYQHAMDYWAATMQDDCYLIAADGWKAETSRIIERDKKGKERDKGWACDLVPKSLIVARYFAKEQAAIDALNMELESISARLVELEEEHSGEEGAFSELDKVNKASVTARLKEIDAETAKTKPRKAELKVAEPAARYLVNAVILDDNENADEAEVLRMWLGLYGVEAGLKRRIKDAEAKLDADCYAKYPMLSEDNVKSLVVDDKWMAALDAAVHGEMDRITQKLTQRVMDLYERYGTPMSQVTDLVTVLEADVNRHLNSMGFAWT
jgi:type I restriction enzyme M protein